MALAGVHRTWRPRSNDARTVPPQLDPSSKRQGTARFSMAAWMAVDHVGMYMGIPIVAATKD